MSETLRPPHTFFSGPVKHSITIAGHKTSISLEPAFWTALRRAAGEEGLSVNQLVAQIDDMRIASLSGKRSADSERTPPPNLASMLRSWLWERYCK